MEYIFKGDNSFPIVEVKLKADEQVNFKSGSMVYHTPSIELLGSMNANGKKGLGGVVSAIGRGVTSGESFFISTAKSHSNDGIVAFAPNSLGPIQVLKLDNQHQWCLNTGSYLVSDFTSGYKMTRQSIGHALLGRTGGLFVMETQGAGEMLISSYGDLLSFDLDGSQDFTIDNNYVVAWQNSLTYKIAPGSGVIGFKSGQGFVNEFSGVGRVYIQTRNVSKIVKIFSGDVPNSSDQ